MKINTNVLLALFLILTFIGTPIIWAYAPPDYAVYFKSVMPLLIVGGLIGLGLIAITKPKNPTQ